MPVESNLVTNSISKRKVERLRRRKRNAESIRRHIEAGGEYVSKRDKIRLTKEKMENSLKNGLKFCIDCSFEGNMSSKEHSKFAQQLCRSYGAIKNAVCPLSLHLANFNPAGPLAKTCRKKCSGFDNYQIGFHTESPLEVFKGHKIVYLSPDATEILIEIDKNAVYIAGGLIDESLDKGRSLEAAAKMNVTAVRLPIDEFAPSDWQPENRVKASALPMNTLVAILLDVLHHGDWRRALDLHLQHRFRTHPTLP